MRLIQIGLAAAVALSLALPATSQADTASDVAAGGAWVDEFIWIG